MKKVKLKKLRITKLTNFERLSIKGGYSKEDEHSHVPPCQPQTVNDDCPDSRLGKTKPD
jgi:hypothetical protein